MGDASLLPLGWFDSELVDFSTAVAKTGADSATAAETVGLYVFRRPVLESPAMVETPAVTVRISTTDTAVAIDSSVGAIVAETRAASDTATAAESVGLYVFRPALETPPP